LLVDSVQSVYDVSQLHKFVSGARIARCRQRFVVPVILFEGKVDILSRSLSELKYLVYTGVRDLA